MQEKEPIPKKEQLDEIVISDTCCLISFEKIDHLELLKDLYQKLYVTPDVLREYEGGGAKLPSFIAIKEVHDQRRINDFVNMGLHLGEASSIALYEECKNALLLTDDSGAREYAERNNLNYATTLDVLVEARELGYLKSNKELHNALDKIVQVKRWVSEELINVIKDNYKIDFIQNDSLDKTTDEFTPIKTLNSLKVKMIMANIKEAYQTQLNEEQRDLLQRKTQKNDKRYENDAKICKDTINLLNKALITNKEKDILTFHESFRKGPGNECIYNDFKYKKLRTKIYQQVEEIIKNKLINEYPNLSPLSKKSKKYD